MAAWALDLEMTPTMGCAGPKRTLLPIGWNPSHGRVFLVKHGAAIRQSQRTPCPTAPRSLRSSALSALCRLTGPAIAHARLGQDQGWQRGIGFWPLGDLFGKK